MLEENYSGKLALLLERLQPCVELPEGWTDYFTRCGALPTAPEERRQFARRCLREEAICELGKSLPAIDRRHEFSKVFLKDISRGGVAFLAAQQLYPGEHLTLWTRGGKLPCSVVRCTRHNDRCYEIGSRFPKSREG
jgi:hypothetical protein